MSARWTALQVLTRCRKENGWSNGLLKAQIAKDRLDKRDAALATRLCYGILQNRRLLDFYLQQVLSGKLKHLRPVVRDLLHLGLYQLLLMDKIPASAAVNETVTMAKQLCKSQPHAAGLINGVLRNAAAKTDWIQPAELAVRYSHPDGLVQLLRSYVGEERLEAMLSANNAAPETVLQVNRLKTTQAQLLEDLQAQGITARVHPWMKDCLVVSGTGSIDRLEAFQMGHFYVQDAAAKLAVDCAGIRPGEFLVTDCCGAPGGKSFAAAMALGMLAWIRSSRIYLIFTVLIGLYMGYLLFVFYLNLYFLLIN